MPSRSASEQSAAAPTARTIGTAACCQPTAAIGGPGNDHVEATGGIVTYLFGDGQTEGEQPDDGDDVLVNRGTNRVVAYGAGGDDEILTGPVGDQVFAGSGSDQIDTGFRADDRGELALWLEEAA